MESTLICRSCLTNITHEYIDLDTPMDQTTYLESFNYSTGLNANLDDDLPSSICVPCGTRLQVAYEFIIAALDADRMLRNSLVHSHNLDDLENKCEVEIVKDITNIDSTIIEEECFESSEVIKEEPIDIETLESHTHEELTVELIEDYKTENEPETETEYNRDKETYNELGELSELLYLCDEVPSDIEGTQYEHEEHHTFQQEEHNFVPSSDQEEATQKTSKNKNAKKEKPPFACETCGKVFKSFQSRNRHSFLVHQQRNGEKQKCNVCDFSTSSMSSWLSHKYRHKRPVEKKYLCAYCPMAFINPKTLYMHEDYKHGNKEKASQCEKCNKKFLNKQKLKAHILSVHTNGRNYQCPQCPKTFKNNFQLRAHIKLHTDRSIDCPQCDKKFVRQVDLKVHMRSHTGELPFQCHLCEKRYAIKVRLTYHLQKHLGTKHKCEHCTSEFNSKPKLRLHMFTHIGMPFVCDHCQMGYPTRLGLRRHSKNVHKITLTDEELLQNRIKNEKNLKRGIVSKNALLSPNSSAGENEFEI